MIARAKDGLEGARKRRDGIEAATKYLLHSNLRRRLAKQHRRAVAWGYAFGFGAMIVATMWLAA